MAIYSTLYGLPQSMVDYLNQPLPDISGLRYTPVEAPTIEDVITEEGIASLYPQVAASGDGGGFSPYSIDPRDVTIRTSDQYNPYAYNRAMRDTVTFSGDTVMPNPDLYYAPQTKLEELMSKIPTPLGFVKKGLDAIADKLGPNRTAIFQNELLGQGIKLDNIGRIVTDNYRTPEGIMAGYNPVSGGLLNMLTGGAYGEPTQYGLEKAVEKRQENIRNTLKDKYRLSNKQIDDVLAEIEETGTYKGPLGFNQIMGKTTNLFTDLFNLGIFNQKQLDAKKKADIIFEQKRLDKIKSDPIKAAAEAQGISKAEATQQAKAIEKENKATTGGGGGGGGGSSGGSKSSGGGDGWGSFCFDPNTPIQMADGSEKKIKDIQLGDDTKGGEVTGVFQFKAADEIHDYKGVTVAGSHYVKEDGKFIMVKDSPIATKIDKIPVVYSLDTSGRRIFIKDIEFADYNGDGIAKGFLENAGVNLSGFDKEVLRQVEHRLI
jgi:hypothetical protein